jgi:PBP1b-binding outer membrane lipoprotein LpoB
MKKLSIIAGLVFTTVFFASCESDEVMPQVNNSNSSIQNVDFQEPEFATQKRPNVKTSESTIIPASTETISVVENKLEK